MEIQQSPLYAQYIRQLKWIIELVDGTNIFIRRFPFLGTMAKIQRPVKLPDIKKTIITLKRYNVRTIVAEADHTTDPHAFAKWCNALRREFSITESPYLPTKTIRINLKPTEEEIFASFASAKRRAIRRATKLGVSVRQSGNIDTLISIKNKSAGLFGFITTYGMSKLWPIFSPDNAAIVLAYAPTNLMFQKEKRQNLVGGVLLLLWDKTAYYWLVGATKQGKKLFAPSLLVWHALTLSKSRGMQYFDFVGVWDERLPKQYDTWKGFTKFKEGFGGETVYYPLNTQ